MLTCARVSLLLLAACGPSRAELDRLTADLDAALASGDSARISAAARAAGAHEGRLAALDLRLARAFSHHLGRPADALPVLEHHPAPQDPAWAEVYAGAALRIGSPGALEAARARLAWPEIDLHHPAVEQMAARARLDAAVSWADLVDVLGACALLDGAPDRGRVSIGRRASPRLAQAATALGATRVALGRPERRDDHDPLAGTGAIQCKKHRLIEAPSGWPAPLPRAFTVAAADAAGSVWVDVLVQEGDPVAYGANDAAAAGRWLDAADWLDAAPPAGGAVGTTREESLRALFGPGLGAVRLPDEPAAP